MATNRTHPLLDLSAEDARRVDAVCRAFEAAWSGDRPRRIEDHLPGDSGPVRDALAFELIALEVELRRARGERPWADDYRARFPDQATAIARALADLPPTPRPAAPIAEAETLRMPVDPADVATALHAPVGEAETKALNGSTTVREPEPRAIRELGPYKLMAELARGGMGVVYRARQAELNRDVALKLILAGPSAAASDVQRFHAEAEAAANLDHPNIVPIYDIGEHDGQPYFTMRLIDGGSLAGSARHLAGQCRESAQLVAKVARAVHYAHQRGILHRDLKPQNILIDGRGEPHVTDFGLAKRVDVDSGLTQSGAVLGTPGYMPPEQASGRRSAITTASDVYSLGAILYELLNGQAPFRAETAMDVLMQVLEREPERPRNRDPHIPRDLETICLKCLEKEPGRRYPTAEALAEDLERWLRGETIHARPSTSWERGVKWARRRPAVAALGAALIVVLAIATGGATWTAVQFRTRAIREKKAREDAETARVVAQRAQAAAEANFGLAREAVDRSFTQISSERLLNQPHMARLRKDLLGTARDFYQRLVEQHHDDPTARADLGKAYIRLAEMARALGDKVEARAHAEQARSIFQALHAGDPSSVASRRGLARSHLKLGEYERDLGRMPESEASYRRAVALFGAIVAEHPDFAEDRYDLAKSHNDLGFLYRGRGRVRDAEAAHLEALRHRRQVVAEHSDNVSYRTELAWSHHFLGLIYRDTNRLAAAERSQHQAMAIRGRLVVEHPEAADCRNNLAFSLSSMGELYALTGRLSAALAEHRRALAICEQLANDYPKLAFYRFTLSSCLRYAAATCDRAHRHREAEQHYDRALGIFEELFAEFPDDQFYLQDLNALVNLFAKHYTLTRQPIKAVELRRRVLAIHDRRAAGRPESRASRRQRIFNRIGLANIEQKLGHWDDARRSYTTIRSMLAALADPDPIDLYNQACVEAVIGKLDDRGMSAPSPGAGPHTIGR